MTVLHGGVVSLRASRLAVASIFLINGFSLSNWLARIPDVKQELALGEQMLGIVLLCAAIGALLAQPVVGWLIPRFGSRRLTILMAVAFCLSLVLPGLATSVPTMMAALFVLGAFNGGLDVSMNAQAAMVEERYGRSIMNSFHGLWSIGGLCGASVGGLMAAQRVPLHMHLLVIAVCALLASLLASRWLLADTSAHSDAGPSFALPPRALFLIGFIAFGVLCCEGAISDWSAVYLRETLGANAAVGSLGFAVFSLLMAAGRLSGDMLTQRLGALLMIRGGGVLIALGMALVVMSNTPWVAVVGFALVGAGMACLFPLLLSTAARTPGVASSTGIAAIATMGYTGFLVGPPLIGTLAEGLTLRVALVFLLVLGVFVAVFGGAIQPRGGSAVAS